MVVDFCKMYPQNNVGLPCSDVVFSPDFGTLGKLQEKYGNDIDMMINKPQYRDLINSNLQPIESASQFADLGLSDEQKLDLLPSREFDVNELSEYMRTVGKQYADERKSDDA